MVSVMKNFLLGSLLLFAALPLQAQIFADFDTTLGDFTVELDYTNSPRAVASFITLAEGSRPWIDSTTGAVQTNKPYYEGITFHRVIDGFVIQAGSQNGTGSDGPGYSFPDEVDNGLSFNTPYLLAMANSGPNTNGSQFFITVGTPTNLNGVHTIFGSVSAGTSVVDTINDVPTSGNPSNRPLTDVVINTVAIRRVGDEATAFDEFSQVLPVIQEVAIEFDFDSENAPLLGFTQPPASTINIRQSEDLMNWEVVDSSNFLDSSLLYRSSASPSAVRSYSANNDPNTNFSPPQLFFTPSLTVWPNDTNGFETYVNSSLSILLPDQSQVDFSLLNSLSREDGVTNPIIAFSQTPRGYGATLFIQGYNSDTSIRTSYSLTIGFDGARAGRYTGRRWEESVEPDMLGRAIFTDPSNIGGIFQFF